MADIYYNESKRSTSSWIYKLLLFLSFVWISIFTSANYLTSTFYSVSSELNYGYNTFYYSFGNLFDVNSANFSIEIIQVLSFALVEWLIFEVIFYIYRQLLTFKIYTFVIPLWKFKNECRVFYIYRNIIYGIFVNICFLFPFLQGFLYFFSIVSSLIILLFFAYYLSKKYSETIIAHFVFKNFALPLFVFEGILLLFNLWGLL